MRWSHRRRLTLINVWFNHEAERSAALIIILAILAVVLEFQLVDGFQQNLLVRYGLCRRSQTPVPFCRGTGRQRLPSSLPGSQVDDNHARRVVLRYNEQLRSFHNRQPSHPRGHPALLQAIADFPQAIQHKQTELNSPFTVDALRIFHGRGGLIEGANHLTLDFYPPVFLLTAYQELAEEELNSYGDALNSMWTSLVGNNDEDAIPLTWIYESRAKRWPKKRLMSGEIPEPHIVTESNGKNKFLVHLMTSINHGLFLDMSAGRQWVQDQCANGGTVLNLFAYTCGFSVAALNGGAGLVVNVDMEREFLDIGQKNHELNAFTSGSAKFLACNMFKQWGKIEIKNLGPYDIVVADPPTYQPGSFDAAIDYIKVIRRLPSLLRPNGYALLCLDYGVTMGITTEFMLKMLSEGDPNNELCFVERLENPPAFASAFPDRGLKVLVFQYRPSNDNN